MFAHQKRLLTTFAIIGLYLTGCLNHVQKEIPMESTEQTVAGDVHNDATIHEEGITPYPDTGTEGEIMFSIGVKTKELSNIPEIDDPAILVNGQPITKREIETQRIMDNARKTIPLKKSIDVLIRVKALQIEAEWLGIEPAQDRIDTYLEDIKSAFDSGEDVGNEVVFEYMKGLEMTEEEFLAEQKKAAYKLFRQAALWESVEPSKKYKDIKEYGNKLVEKAKIEFLDPDIENLYLEN